MSEKLERMRQEEWNHRCRVLADRQRFELHEALLCVGHCPGERTYTDDWVFWHGFEPDKEAEMCAKNKRMEKAKHCQGCGGSQELLRILRLRRAQSNRRLQHEKTAASSPET